MLLALALALPWFLLRDSEVLRIPSREIDRLTPTAERTLRDRQSDLAALQDALPWISVCLAVAGAGFLLVGGKRMKSSQGWEDIQQEARAEKAKAEIRPQTESERLEELDEEPSEAVASDGSPARPAGQDQEARPRAPAQSATDERGSPSVQRESERAVPRSRSPARADYGRLRKEADELEALVLDELQGVIPEGYRLRPQVTVVAPTASKLLLDALIEPQDPRSNPGPDILVEIKMIRGAWIAARHAADRLLADLLRYRYITGKECYGWLIGVAVDPTALTASHEVRLAKALPPAAILTLVTPESMGGLSTVAIPESFVAQATKPGAIRES
jgi:hypothetical protein